MNATQNPSAAPTEPAAETPAPVAPQSGQYRPPTSLGMRSAYTTTPAGGYPLPRSMTGARTVSQINIRPSQIRPAVQSQLRPAVESQVRPAIQSQLRPAVESQMRPAVEMAPPAAASTERLEAVRQLPSSMLARPVSKVYGPVTPARHAAQSQAVHVDNPAETYTKPSTSSHPNPLAGGADERQDYRHPCELDCSVNLGGKTVDLGMGGVGMIAPFFVDVGTRLVLDINCAVQVLQKVECRVVAVDTLSRHYHLHLQFVSLTPQQKKDLWKALTILQARPTAKYQG